MVSPRTSGSELFRRTTARASRPRRRLDEDRSLWRAVGAYFCSVLVVVVVVFVVLEGFVATTLETIIESPSLT
jgi:anti-sigma-K factor RskA